VVKRSDGTVKGLTGSRAKIEHLMAAEISSNDAQKSKPHANIFPAAATSAMGWT
jgi:hypothetical protein